MEIAIEYAALLVGAGFLALVVLFSIGFFSRGNRSSGAEDRFIPGNYDGHDHGHHDGGGADGGHGH